MRGDGRFGYLAPNGKMNGRYRVLLEKVTKGAWGSARRCHLVKTT